MVGKTLVLAVALSFAAVDDLWFSSRRTFGSDGKKLPPTPTKRHGRGKRWRVRYFDDGGRKVEKLFAQKADAERFDAAVRTDVDRGLCIDPADGKQTVAAYAATWREARLHRGSTGELIEGTFRRHINPVLGHLPIARVQARRSRRGRSRWIWPQPLPALPTRIWRACSAPRSAIA